MFDEPKRLKPFDRAMDGHSTAANTFGEGGLRRKDARFCGFIAIRTQSAIQPDVDVLKARVKHDGFGDHNEAILFTHTHIDCGRLLVAVQPRFETLHGVEKGQWLHLHLPAVIGRYGVVQRG